AAWFAEREARRVSIDTQLNQELHANTLIEGGIKAKADRGSQRVRDWLRGGQIAIDELADIVTGIDPLDALTIEMVEDAIYEPYLLRQDAELRDLKAGERLSLPSDFPYGRVPGLSNEMVERLSKAQPETLSAAGRIPGITPAALAALLVHARRLEERAA
ncbi:MAG: tRNA uridine-5-carboxymethylaminomethyl(34) synthesis enzyme MnmG, partial [Erythrobacter sp.]|nr:tRNA uridine-5-carboxymethylaminomethyl(34) synthesis enzyme MnmG [Erythrobacter sp.]